MLETSKSTTNSSSHPGWVGHGPPQIEEASLCESPHKTDANSARGRTCTRFFPDSLPQPYGFSLSLACGSGCSGQEERASEAGSFTFAGMSL